VGLYGFVAGVQCGFEEEDGSDAAGHFLDVADFVFRERAAKQRFFAVREPFLDDLITADGAPPSRLFPPTGFTSKGTSEFAPRIVHVPAESRVRGGPIEHRRCGIS
jgi:hypothetical protein